MTEVTDRAADDFEVFSLEAKIAESLGSPDGRCSRGQKVLEEKRASHEKELRAFIIKYEQEGRGANEWQSRYDGLKARIQRGEELRAACQELEAKIADAMKLRDPYGGASQTR